jgi:hypothetical protein
MIRGAVNKLIRGSVSQAENKTGRLWEFRFWIIMNWFWVSLLAFRCTSPSVTNSCHIISTSLNRQISLPKSSTFESKSTFAWDTELMESCPLDACEIYRCMTLLEGFVIAILASHALSWFLLLVHFSHQNLSDIQCEI